MANRMTNEVRALHQDFVLVAGSFAPNGSSAVAASSRKGRGFSVARTDVGEFTLTLSDKYPNLISAVATLQQATAGDQFLQVGEYDEDAKTIVITAIDASGAAAADVAADANNRVNFVLVFQNSTVGPLAG